LAAAIGDRDQWKRHSQAGRERRLYARQALYRGLLKTKRKDRGAIGGKKGERSVRHHKKESTKGIEEKGGTFSEEEEAAFQIPEEGGGVVKMGSLASIILPNRAARSLWKKERGATSSWCTPRGTGHPNPGVGLKNFMEGKKWARASCAKGVGIKRKFDLS